MSTFSNLLYHIIFSTKFRRRAIVADWQDDLYAYIGGIVRDQRGKLLRIGGVEDHVHLLLKLGPTIALSEVVQKIKGNSSKWINSCPKVGAKFEWQTGYAAFAVSESQSLSVMEYISNQKEHHRMRSFREELVLILEKHNIEFDMQYLFQD